MTKKILVIAFEFPPIRASNDRTYYFCRYLLSYGWQPIVISPRRLSGWMLYDYTIKIPSEIEVYNASAFQNKWIGRCHWRLGLLPDINLFMFTSYITGRKILSKKQDIKIVYATTPSSSALFSAYLLSKKYNKPLVLDFRDPFYPPIIYKGLFRRILRFSHKIITTTQVYKNILIEQGADRNKIEIIPNGTDLDMIETIRKKGIAKSTQFTVIYAGILLPLYRVKALLNAILKLKSLDIRVVIVGRLEDDTEGLIEFVQENGLNNVEFRGRLSYEETIKELLRTTVGYNGSAHLGGIGGKVYDYLACGLPILGFNPKGSATYSFIEENKVGLVSEGEEGLVENLKKLYENLSSVVFFSQRAKKVSVEYDRKNLTKKLSEILSVV